MLKPPGLIVAGEKVTANVGGAAETAELPRPATSNSTKITKCLHIGQL